MANVTAAKPKSGGALLVGATTATLPTSTDATLTGFTSLGNISDDGMTNDMSRESENIKNWGGQTVLSPQTEVTNTWKCTLIDALDVNVLKEIYGASNVSGTLATGITIKTNATELVARAWVIDMVMADGVLERVVIPSGQITSVGEVSYKDNEAVGYEITITAYPDSTGNTDYKYIKG